MHRSKHCIIMCWLGAGIVTLVGCSSKGTSVKTQPVKGLVTLDGTPVAGANVTFVPATAGQGMSAAGYTDENGIYKLTAMATGDATAEAGAGTLPGDYVVSISKTVADTPMSEEEAEEKGVKYTPPAVGKGPTVENVIPTKYKIPKTSGLTATVKEGENDIPFELSSN